MTTSLFRSLAAACASALLLAAAPAHASTITLTNIACDDVVVGGVAGARTLTCTTTTSPPPTSGGVPTGCSLSASPSSLTGSGTVTLAASCSGGGAPTSFAWTGGAVTTQTAAGTQVITVAATTTFYVTPSNASGPGNQAQATVTVSASPPAPPPASGASCGNYVATEMGAVQMNGVAVLSRNFGANTVAIASFTVPAGYPTTTNTIAIFEYVSAPTYRKAWMSKTRCDMSATAPPYFLSSDGPVFQYSIGGTDPNAVAMRAGETWYLMIVNERPFGLGPSCGSGTCDIGIKWYPPLQ